MKKSLIIAGCILLAVTGSAPAQELGLVLSNSTGGGELVANTGAEGENFGVELFGNDGSGTTGIFTGTSTGIGSQITADGSTGTTPGGPITSPGVFAYAAGPTNTFATTMPFNTIGSYDVAIQVNGFNEPQGNFHGGSSPTNLTPFRGFVPGIGNDNIQVQFDNLTPENSYQITIYAGGFGSEEGAQFFDGALGTNLSLATSTTALDAVLTSSTVGESSFVAVGTGVTNANYVTDTLIAPADGELSFDLVSADTEDAASLTAVDDTTVLNGFSINDLTTESVPEPPTWALLGLGGLGGMLLIIRIRRKAAMA